MPLKYDNIWTLDEEYIHSIKVSINGKEHSIDASTLIKENTLTGLIFIKTYTVEDFKAEFGMSKIVVKADPKTGRMFFPFRTSYGEIAFGDSMPKEEISVSFVLNAQGKVFPLLHLTKDTGKPLLRKSFCKIKKKVIVPKQREHFRWADEEACDELDDNIGWSRDEIESGLADAFEGDYDNYISR